MINLYSLQIVYFMQIEQLYNQVAKTYNQNMSGAVLEKAKRMALDLVLQEGREINSILALGVGDGTDLLPYKEHYPKAELHGLDISRSMLDKAEVNLNCKAYHGDIAHASEMIHKRNFELVLAHFVTAYVPLPIILRESRQLVSSQGLLSVVTNTMGSFPEMQSIMPKLGKTANPFERLTFYHINKTLKKVYVPKNLDDLQKNIEDNGFRVKALMEKSIELTLNNDKEVYDFFINGGWFVSGLIHPLLPHHLLRQICSRLISKYVTTPYKDSMKIAMAIAEPV